jgi:hypothetical protein
MMLLLVEPPPIMQHCRQTRQVADQGRPSWSEVDIRWVDQLGWLL